MNELNGDVNCRVCGCAPTNFHKYSENGVKRNQTHKDLKDVNEQSSSLGTCCFISEGESTSSRFFLSLKNLTSSHVTDCKSFFAISSLCVDFVCDKKWRRKQKQEKTFSLTSNLRNPKHSGLFQQRLFRNWLKTNLSVIGRISIQRSEWTNLSSLRIISITYFSLLY